MLMRKNNRVFSICVYTNARAYVPDMPNNTKQKSRSWTLFLLLSRVREQSVRLMMNSPIWRGKPEYACFAMDKFKKKAPKIILLVLKKKKKKKTKTKKQHFWNPCFECLVFNNNNKFTMPELEENQEIPFLDVLVKRHQNTFSTTVHRKKTFTSLYTKWDAFTPLHNRFNPHTLPIVFSSVRHFLHCRLLSLILRKHYF